MPILSNSYNFEILKLSISSVCQEFERPKETGLNVDALSELKSGSLVLSIPDALRVGVVVIVLSIEISTKAFIDVHH